MRLYNNSEKRERECGKCRQIKPYSEFKNRSDLPHIKRSICKKCEIIIEANRLQTKSWIHKIHAIKLVTNDQNKCQICNEIGIENLPMLDFHHPDPNLSTVSAREKGFWRSVRYKSWSYIRNELLKQKVIVICRNCHMKLQSIILSKYKDLILNFNDPTLITRNLISDHAMKQAIQRYIRKKIILFDIWDGMCTKCGFGISFNNIDNLPALEIHHINPEIKSDVLSYYLRVISDINRIKDIIKKENCICLCRNCHIMVQSTFFNENKAKIFKRYKQKFC
ncbi:MAG: hypothetical protein V3V33_14465 [Candidatus Lokiarchaeia archaeon]